MTAKKAGRGRPTAYRAEFVGQARQLALLGLIDTQMAEVFGVSERTFHEWKKAHPDFKQALAEGKTLADARVAESLYRAAVGGGTIRQVRSETDPTGEETRTVTESELPGDVSAMRWWLKNRQAELWRDKVEVEADIALMPMNIESLNQKFVAKMDAARRRQDEVLAERRTMGLCDPE